MKTKILFIGVTLILIVGIIIQLNLDGIVKESNQVIKDDDSKIVEETKLEKDFKIEDEDNKVFSESEKKEEKTEIVKEPPIIETQITESKTPNKNEIIESKEPVKKETEPVVKEEPKVEEVKPTAPTPDPIVPEIEEPVEEIDYGYIEAMKEVEYLTEQECFDAGMEKSFSDADSVIGFDVRELYYGGKIIGYKLILRYENPME